MESALYFPAQTSSNPDSVERPKASPSSSKEMLRYLVNSPVVDYPTVSTSHNNNNNNNNNFINDLFENPEPWPAHHYDQDDSSSYYSSSPSTQATHSRFLTPLSDIEIQGLPDRLLDSAVGPDLLYPYPANQTFRPNYLNVPSRGFGSNEYHSNSISRTPSPLSATASSSYTPPRADSNSSPLSSISTFTESDFQTPSYKPEHEKNTYGSYYTPRYVTVAELTGDREYLYHNEHGAPEILRGVDYSQPHSPYDERDNVFKKACGSSFSNDSADRTVTITGLNKRKRSHSNDGSNSSQQDIAGIRSARYARTTRSGLNYAAYAQSESENSGSEYNPSPSPSPNYDYSALPNDHVAFKHEQLDSDTKNYHLPPSHYPGQDGRLYGYDASNEHGSPYDNDMSSYEPSRRRTTTLPLPVVVPGLVKKSRGRKVPDVLQRSQDQEEYADYSDGDSYGKRPRANRKCVTDGAGMGTGNAPRRAISNKARMFICPVEGCGKGFVRGEHLKRHVRSLHTYEKPHPCPHPKCDKSFSRLDNLKQHQKTHRS